MEILLGTSNPAKVKQFQIWLAGEDVRFLTLNDLSVPGEPEENGSTPGENARRKAEYYGRYHDYTICNDSGLYFAGLPLEDARQPGLHVRSPGGLARRLNEEEMLAYYGELARSLGGRVRACYLNGFAVKTPGGIYVYEDRLEDAMEAYFWMTDTPCPERRPGWPLDSLSVRRDGTRFLQPPRRKEKNPCEKRWICFLKDALAKGRGA